MAKKVITVFGATGSQGNSVVQAFLGDDLKDEWQVRGVTRDVTKDSAKKLASQGVEVVSANMDDKASLVKAMTGATAVFAVTNYWETMSAETETKQGKNLADAAKEAGVKHYILSSLLNIKELSKGVLPDVYHFDSKAKAEEYTRSLGIPASFFLAGFYMSNLSGGMIRPQGPDNTWTLAMPVPESSPVPMFDARADTGKFVKGMVLAGDKVFGKRVLGATSYMTFGEIIETFRKTFPEDGKTATFVEVPQAAFKNVLMTQQGMPDFAAEEMLQNMRLLNEFGYYGGASLDESHAILKDKLTTWEEHLKKALPNLK